MRPFRLLSLAISGCLLAAACSSSDGSDTATTEPASPSAAASDEDTGSDEAGSDGPAAIVAQPWEVHETPDDCVCADGSPYSFASRVVDPTRVVLYFEGGGACFSAETCSFTDGTYKVQAGTERFADAERDEGPGIFDASNPDNPLREWSFVFAPYCTGDVHLGENVQDYGDGVVVNHLGFRNARHPFEHLLEQFPDAEEVLVTGSSAGGIPAPLFGALVADELPDAEVRVLADASGVYPDNPPVNVAIGTLWGAFDNVPDWPETAGFEPEDFSIPGLFSLAGQHRPDIAFARFDNAYDSTQASFVSLSNIAEGEDQLDLLLGNEEAIEASGVPISGYVAPGTAHTVLAGNSLYTLETEGVAFLDWLTDFVEGRPVDDVRCTDCGAPDS